MPLTSIEKYAIQGMIADEKDVKEIKKVVKKPEKMINDYIQKLIKANIVPEEVDTKKTKRKPTLMINTSSVKRNRGVSIMTKAASERFDAAKQAARNAVKTNDIERRIFRPFGGE